MTFSGLPSVRDPKQSLKNSGSSASSATSSSTSSSPTKSPPPQDQDQDQDQDQQQRQQQQQQQLLTDASESNTTTSFATTSSHPSSSEHGAKALVSHDASSTVAPLPQGLVASAHSTEPMSAALIEKSFQDLVQANFGDSAGAVSGSNMMDMSGLLVGGGSSHSHLGSYPSTSCAGSGAAADLNNQHHHHHLALGLDLNLNLQQQQHQPLQIHSGMPLPSLQVELRHPQPPQLPLMQPPSSANNNASSKKKTAPQTLSPAHSAAYRKRLNVNQVCDWCRYRKIRCDRESPCNSCQHSKRECIRSPAAALLGNSGSGQEDISMTDDNTSTTNDRSSSPSTPASGKTKRSRVDTLSDGRSRRASKSYRGSSISSHLSSSSVTSYSSDDDNDSNLNDAASGSSSRASDQASLSPVVGSLTLAELGLAGFGLDASLSPTSRRDHHLGSPSSLTSSPSFTTNMLALENPQTNNLQDQEHLERMRRIEMLLSNVIPGAAEFIAQGNSSSLGHLLPGQKQQQQKQQHQRQSSKDMGDFSSERKKSLSLITHGLDHSNRETILSPQDRLSKIALSSPARMDGRPRPNSSPSGLLSVHEEEKGDHSWQQQQQQRQAGADYIERMKRIELLLGSVQDTQLAKALISQTQRGESLSSESSSRATSADAVSNDKNERKMSKDTKKMSKAEARRVSAAANGAIVKRPHVAAGFAGQKPPPKLPQAIAEAASKKLATRKKRVSAAAARAAAAASAASSSSSSTPVIASAAAAVTPISGGEDANSTTGSTNSSTTPEMASSAMHSMYGQDHTRVAAPSPTASLEIPSTFEPQDHAMIFSQQHQQYQQQQQAHFFAQQQQQQQQQQQFNLAAQHQDSISFQQQLQQQQQQRQQQNHQGFMAYQHQPFAMSSVGSMTIPLSTDPTIGNYGSLVVPASSSTSSSPTMSPRSTRADSVSSKSVMDESSSGPMSLLQQQQQLAYSAGSSQMQGVVGYDMAGFDLVGQQQQQQQQQQSLGTRDSQIHPFTIPQGPSSYGQQPHHHHNHQHHQSHPSMTIGADGFAEFGLGMSESLESLMKKNMGSLDRLMGNLASENNQQQQSSAATTAAAGTSNNGPQTPSHSEGPNMFDPSTQMAYLQQQQQHQQHQQHQQGMYPDMSRSLWMPSHTGAFTIPSKVDEFSWSPQSQQQQPPLHQQQSSQSINISANDSPELELDLEQLQNQQQQQQQQQQQKQSAQEQMQRQKQLNAHALFQQQHQQQQQQRHLEQLQQKQQQQQQQQNLQTRKGSFVVGMPQQPQHHHQRASIQHQHQQTFYIPQMQDDEDDAGFQSMYDNNSEQDETTTPPPPPPTSAPSSSGSVTVSTAVSSSLEQ